MKKMNAINIDKWRSLNVELFDSYIETYYKLSQNSLLDPAQTLIDVFDKNKIKGELTKDGYGSAYTIAREIGIYFEDSNNYYLSSIAENRNKSNKLQSPKPHTCHALAKHSTQRIRGKNALSV